MVDQSRLTKVVRSKGDSPVSVPDEPPPPRDIEREVGHVSVGRSTLRHLRLVVGLTVAGLVIGLAYGVVRSPTYKAEARLIVGQNLTLTNEAATAGLPAADAQFAANYSRLAGTEAVQADAAKRLGHPNTLGGSLSASPIPNSPIMRVDATAGSQAAAVAIANAGAKAIIDEVNAINNGNKATLDALLHEYQQLQSQVTNDNEQLSSLRSQAAASPNNSSLQGQISRLQGEVDVATLQATAVENQYQNQYSPVQADTNVVTQISAALPTGSDRKSYLAIGGIAGLLAGLVVSMALASVIEVRRGSIRSSRSQDGHGPDTAY